MKGLSQPSRGDGGTCLCAQHEPLSKPAIRFQCRYMSIRQTKPRKEVVVYINKCNLEGTCRV